MDPDLRRHMIALLEIMMKHSEQAGMTEERAAEGERSLNLDRDEIREAMKYLQSRGAAKTTFDDPKLPYGFRQAFVTDAGRLYYHQLVEESGQIIKRTSRKIFIIHGRDEENKDALKEMFFLWDFEPLVMAELPSMNLTLIEKLVHYVKDVEFAFVLMTPDDVGASWKDFINFLKDFTQEVVEGVDQISDRMIAEGRRLRNERDEEAIRSLLGNLDIQFERKMKRRVRQNVLFEYGLCVGKLGRENVCPILKGEVEIPTDILGAVYIPFKDKVSECKDKIRQELQAAGYEISVDE